MDMENLFKINKAFYISTVVKAKMLLYSFNLIALYFPWKGNEGKRKCTSVADFL